jgi:uncharacterized membrane protein YhdT
MTEPGKQSPFVLLSFAINIFRQQAQVGANDSKHVHLVLAPFRKSGFNTICVAIALCSALAKTFLVQKHCFIVIYYISNRAVNWRINTWFCTKYQSCALYHLHFCLLHVKLEIKCIYCDISLSVHDQGLYENRENRLQAWYKILPAK